MKAPSNNELIVVKNIAPKAWSGRDFDVGAYKDDRLLVIEKGVRVKTKADFLLQPKITFAVAQNIAPGQTFTSADITSSQATYDLSKYPDGVLVTLSKGGGGGEYIFDAQAMWARNAEVLDDWLTRI